MSRLPAIGPRRPPVLAQVGNEILREFGWIPIGHPVIPVSTTVANRCSRNHPTLRPKERKEPGDQQRNYTAHVAGQPLVETLRAGLALAR